MWRIRPVLASFVLMFASGNAYAYGEIFLYPFGTFFATAIVFVYSLFRPYRWWVRIAACTASLAASVLVVGYEIFFPSPTQFSQPHFFAVGFFPSLIAGSSTAFLLHRWRGRAKSSAPQSP
jgi:hypothetical protein